MILPEGNRVKTKAIESFEELVKAFSPLVANALDQQGNQEYIRACETMMDESPFTSWETAILFVCGVQLCVHEFTSMTDTATTAMKLSDDQHLHAVMDDVPVDDMGFRMFVVQQTFTLAMNTVMAVIGAWAIDHPDRATQLIVASNEEG